jgi:hypothetical protein
VNRRRTLPQWLRVTGRPRWWQEIVFIGSCYALYTLTRNSLPDHVVAAVHRAKAIYRFEGTLHLDPEHALNRFVAHFHALAYLSNYYYATMHFVVTVGVLGWLFFRHPERYRAVRSVLFLTTGLALLGFWLYALAPPRMLAGDGFVDTVLRFHTWGSWGSGTVAKVSNQYAAMPSLHTAWALWCGITVYLLARRRWVRWLGLAYPAATLFVILGTANHFLLDAVGGAVTFATAMAAQRLAAGSWPYALGVVARRKLAIAGTVMAGASSTGK